MKKKYIIITSVIVLLGLGIGSYFLFFSKKDKDKKDTEIVSVKKNDIKSTIESTGKVIPNLEVEIKCKASGEVTSLPFDISDKVKKNDLLLKLNPVDEKRNVKQAEMNLKQSEAVLAKTEQDFSLFGSNSAITKEQLLINLENARNKLNEVETKFERSTALYKLNTQNKLLIADLESAKIKYADAVRKFDNTKKLYKNNTILTKNEYELALNELKQTELQVKIVKEKIKEQQANNKIDYENTLALLKQARNDVKTAELKVKEQNKTVVESVMKEKDIDIARAKVENDKLALMTANQRLKDTQVFSPMNGVITQRNVQIGQIISSGLSSVSGGTAVLTISDLSKLFVMAYIDESNIGNIQLGQKVNISVDAYSDKKFRGKVIQIYTKGNNTSNVVTFPVKIEIQDKKKELLKPEMTASIEIISSEKKGVLSVDSRALTRKKGNYFVKIAKEEDKKSKAEPEERKVTIGITDGENTEILSGLKADEKVLVGGKSESKWRKQIRF